MNPDQQSNYWKPDPEVNTSTAVAPVVPDETPLTPAINDEQALDTQPAATDEVISWKANEYIHMERNTGWFIGVITVAIVLIAVALLLMRSYSFAVLVVVMAVAVILLAKRPPRTLKYTLSPKGIYVADGLHPLEEYKSFGIIRDEGEYSIMLIPIKRFSPGLTVYFPAELGEQIVDFLGKRLPMQELHLDVVDRLVRKLRL